PVIGVRHFIITGQHAAVALTADGGCSCRPAGREIAKVVKHTVTREALQTKRPIQHVLLGHVIVGDIEPIDAESASENSLAVTEDVKGNSDVRIGIEAMSSPA